MTFISIHKLKQSLKTAACLLLALTIAMAPLSLSATAAGSISDKMLRVGIYYGGSALPTANLANEVGSGFRFGYFRSDGSFQELGETTAEAISMLKNTNIYLSGGAYYETPTSSSYSLIGAYHLQLDQTFSSFDEASRRAGELGGAFPAYIDGDYVVRVGSYATADSAKAAATGYSDAFAVNPSSSCIVVTKMHTDTIIFAYDDSGNTDFGVLPSLNDRVKSQTWFKGYQYYGGFEYSRKSGNDISVINIVYIDDYVQGVIPYEISASWHMEALKAQALAARTFGAKTTKHSSLGFDVCTTTNCQVYKGIYEGTDHARVTQAVLETSGECIYYMGALIESVYHSSDGGATEDAENTWGSKMPYLIGKSDPYDKGGNPNQTNWTYEYTLSDFTSRLRSKGVDCADIVSCYVGEFTETGNVLTLVFKDSKGKEYSYWGDQARGFFEDSANGKYFSRRFIIVAPGGSYSEGASTLSGQSISVNSEGNVKDLSEIYVISAEGKQKLSGKIGLISSEGASALEGGGGAAAGDKVNNTGKYLFIGSGWGHNVGMSQWGAKAMAEQGFTYEEIIKFYYTGVDIQ